MFGAREEPGMLGLEEANPRAEAVVSGLGPLVALPKDGIRQYVKLRSDKSVEQLDHLIQGYRKGAQSARGPRTPEWDHPLSGGSQITSTACPASSAAAGDAKSSEDGGKAPSVSAAQRLKDYWKERGVSWRSTTKAFMSTGRFGSAVQKEKPATGSVFDELWRPEHAGDLAAWQEAAADKDVEQMAGHLRGLKYVSNTVMDKSSRTEHRQKYVKHGRVHFHRVSFDRNHSRVPIGSIYSTDPWEIRAYVEREVEIQARMDQVEKEQDAKQWKGKGQTEMSLIALKGDAVKRVREPAEVSRVLSSYISKTQKSEYRGKFVAY